MINRMLKLQIALLAEIKKYEELVTEKRDQPIDWERIHMASCGKVGYFLAEERRIDPILAGCACTVHDYGRIINGKQEGHAEYGYEPVKVFLRKTELFLEEEIREIALAVKNHSKKGEIGTPLEEIVKDADVLDFVQYGFGFAREEQKLRYERLLAIRKTNNFLIR